jgi:hypothetical protein
MQNEKLKDVIYGSYIDSDSDSEDDDSSCDMENKIAQIEEIATSLLAASTAILKAHVSVSRGSGIDRESKMYYSKSYNCSSESSSEEPSLSVVSSSDLNQDLSVIAKSQEVVDKERELASEVECEGIDQIMKRLHKIHEEQEQRFSEQRRQYEAVIKQREDMLNTQANLTNRYEGLKNAYLDATNPCSNAALVEKEHQELEAKYEELNCKYVTLQADHQELKCSHEKLAESHIMLKMENEVLVNSLKSFEPHLSHSTIVLPKLDILCTNSNGPSAKRSWYDIVCEESYDDPIAQESVELK